MSLSVISVIFLGFILLAMAIIVFAYKDSKVIPPIFGLLMLFILIMGFRYSSIIVEGSGTELVSTQRDALQADLDVAYRNTLLFFRAALIGMVLYLILLGVNILYPVFDRRKRREEDRDWRAEKKGW